MNAPLDASAPTLAALADMPLTSAQHLRLALFGVVAQLVQACRDGDVPAALHAHPFLADYLEQIEARVGQGTATPLRWGAALSAWETQATGQSVHLPLLALRHAGLSGLELELLLACGLVEEDPRFGALFADGQGAGQRPSFGLLTAWWRDDGSADDRADEVRGSLQKLIAHGLLQISNPQDLRTEWTLSVALAVWDGLRGEIAALPWLQHIPPGGLTQPADYLAPLAAQPSCVSLSALLAGPSAPVLLLRGPAHNGRKTLAATLAHILGKSLLIARDAVYEDETRWRLFGVLAVIANAIPLIEQELAPGESRKLPALPLAGNAMVVVTGRHGAWASLDARPMLAVELPLPLAAQRLKHWQASLPDKACAALPPSAVALRLASGNIRRVAQAANGLASLDGRDALQVQDLRHACRTLQSARLETLATRLDARGALHELAVDDAVREELDALVARCRWREALAADCPALATVGVGVRALFAGPSGTGKTYAARLIAAELDKDLYRVDLSATVNKYLGETEKNLNQALSAAEELDIVLLLDEGDALMANRTDVGSANDRYANLETNFLLQRIESFEGILLVTSNAADRIDRAFARRMDVVVNFRAPDAWRRFQILKLHLGDIEIGDNWLQEAAERCTLSGGQWRNVVAHARLLALQSSQALQAAHLHAALVREYRKSGANCPLRN